MEGQLQLPPIQDFLARSSAAAASQASFPGPHKSTQAIGPGHEMACCLLPREPLDRC